MLHISNWRRCLAVLAGLLAAAATASAAAETISVSGNTIRKDGAVWTPKGFTLVGYVAPTNAMADWLKGARAHDGPQLLAQARSLGGNTLRYQVSQAGLDPQSSIYAPSYRDEVISAVRRARAAGFVVIVSMQWEPPSGLKGQPGMPSEITQRAWSRLASAFANDGEVMLELFNEPSMWETNPQAWPTWQRGMQALVNEVRGEGSRNILVLDGIHGSHVLEGAPPIHDPIGQIAYAVHPYIEDASKGPDDWERQWGRFAQGHPVFISEWNATSTLQCRPEEPQISRDLISFISQRRIGLILWALDLPNTLLDNGGQPIGFRDFKCGVGGIGAANIAIQYFRGN